MDNLEDLARRRAGTDQTPDSLEELSQAKARLVGVSPKSYRPRMRRAAQQAPTYSFICPNPNCGYIGHRLQKPRGNIIVCILLLLCGGIPGLIYAVLTSGHNYYCPRCNMRLDSDLI